MGVVGHTLFGGPLFHALCHHVGHFAVESCTIVNHIDHFLKDVFRQIPIHLLSVEDLASEVFGRSFIRGLHFERLFLKCFAYNLKS